MKTSGFLILLVGFIFIGLIVYVIVNDIKCDLKGGVATRIGCVKPEIFVK